MLTPHRGSPRDIPVDFLNALTRDPGRLHGVSDTALHFIQRGLTFVWQEGIRRVSKYSPEKSYNIANSPSQHSP